MKIIKKSTSFLIIMCLIFTSVNFQSINVSALQSDDKMMLTSTDTIEDNNLTYNGPEKEEALVSASAIQSDHNAIINIDDSSNSINNELVKDNPVTDINDLSDPRDLLVTGFEETDDIASPVLNKAVINGNRLTLNFDEVLNAKRIPVLDQFTVRIIDNSENDISKDSANTTLSHTAEIVEINVYDSKVALTFADSVTSASAVTLSYTPSGESSLKDYSGNEVKGFSEFEVINITDQTGLPQFVVEEVYNELETSSLSKDLAYQVYYGMLDYKGSKEELIEDTSAIINILSQPSIRYKGLTDENKAKVCSFFKISDEFFVYSDEMGENIEKAISIYFMMTSYGLTDDEVEAAIQNNTRDEIISEKQQEQLDQLNETKMMRAAIASDEDPYAEVKYDKEKNLTAPFQHTNAANEQINLGVGTVDYNVTDAVLPGAGGMDLVIERQYSTEQAGYYDTYGKLQYANKPGKFQPLRMIIYERLIKYKKNADGTMGEIIDKTPFKQFDNTFAESVVLKGLYNMKQIEDKGDYYIAHIYKKEIATISNISSSQTSNPITRNDELWQLGTGWKLNFSYMDIGTPYTYDYIKLHLSDGRNFDVSPNGVNNLGHYTYKDIIFANETVNVAGQTSSYSVTYADGKKEYFNKDGRLIAIVDRFGNTISFVYATVNNKLEITITDTIGRIVKITNTETAEGYNKVLTLPDGKIITYVLRNNTARTLNFFDKYESFPGQNNEYNLSEVINQEGEKTSYTYTDIQCPDDFASRFRSANSKFLSPRTYDDEDTYYPNYYAALTKITYPTGLMVNYEYYERYNNWYDYGCIADIAIKKRYDQQGTKVYNQKEYDYSYRYKKKGVLQDNLYNADGYNNELREDRPFNDTKDWWVQEKDIARNLTAKYTFDYKRGYCVEQSTLLGSKLIQTTAITYRMFNNFMHPSKTRITTQRYDTSDNKPLTTIESYDYDDRGNAISYWPALSEGNTSDTEYKVSMTYDNLYNYLIEKTYKKDTATTISEKNILSENKKNIAQSMVSENGILKARNDFIYDTYGNPIKSKKYTDVSAEAFIETDNTYEDGTYLTGITVQNIKNADGNNLGAVSRYVTHDIYGRILTETDGNGNVTNYTYDKLGRVTKIQYPDESTKIYVYHTASNTTTITDERGFDTRYNYDPAGNLIAVYSINGGTEALLKSNEYDSSYRLTKEQNNLSEGGSATTYNYDHKDRITKKCSVDSANKNLLQEDYTYFDDKTEKTVIGDTTSKAITTTEYTDKYGRVIKQGKFIDGNEIFKTFAYNYLGKLTKEKSARANAESFPEDSTAKYEYDYAGNITKEYDVLGNYIATKYDAAGRKVSVTDAKSNVAGGAYKTVYTYDALGRLLKEETPFTEKTMAVAKYYYDANGNLIQKQVKNSLAGEEESYTKVENVYNNKNKLVQVKSYDGSALVSQVDYKYDLAGNMTTMKTANGSQLTKYEYDRYGDLIALTDPLGQKETYTYNINGNLISKTDKNGVTTNYTYDGLSRKLSQSVIKDEVTKSETMGYTQTGGVAFTQNDNLKIDYTYDGQGRTIKETDSNGIEKEYTYDASGNLKSSDVKVNGVSKKAMNFVYDKKDRLIEVYEAGKLVATYTYDANGNRSSLTYGNGTNVDYAYNLANLVTSLQNRKGTATLSGYVYTYYLNGNQASKKDNKGRLTNYNYDGLGRLVKESESGVADAITKAYAFDEASNRTSMTVSGTEAYTVGYAYDLNNRLTKETKQTRDTVENTDYYYDNNGNTIAKNTGILKNSSGTETPEVSIDMTGTEIYNYDGFDRMTEVQNSSGSSIYTYKPDGLRLSKTVNGMKTTQVWEGQNLSLELDGNGEVSNRYIRGIGLINSDKNGWYLFNGHGDVVQLTDGTGNVTKDYLYDAFGNEKNIDAADTNSYRYCGEYFDKETGEIYLRARYYDSEIGRFISEDSVKGDANDPLSLNRYTYCKNNPIIFVDPSGHIPTVSEAAKMAAQIYSYGKEGKNLSGGWKFDHSIPGGDGMKMGVYYRLKDDGSVEYALVNKGTTPKSLSDWKNNGQQIMGTSADMEASIRNAIDFVNDNLNAEITFVGHSKGGAEAAANAIATNKNAILFNPAAVNLKAYNLTTSGYTGQMTAYIVQGEILNNIEGWASNPIGNVYSLPNQHQNKLHFSKAAKFEHIYNALANHSMAAVIQALHQKGLQ